MTKKLAFLGGLFVICMCALMLQIIETRILSVISYYHLAFFAISMAMFGMTAGSLIVYFNPSVFNSERLLENLSWIAAGFAVATVMSTLVIISTVLIYPWNGAFMSAVLWLKLILALLPPYVFAGMGISLALTRSPWPVGQVYGADLTGAAAGCLGALVLLTLIDGVSAMLMVGALGALAAWIFGRGCGVAELFPDLLPQAPRWLRWLCRPAFLAASLAVLALGNAAAHPNGLVLSFTKGTIEIPFNVEYMRWNAYSRIRVEKTYNDIAAMWGPSPVTPLRRIDQHTLTIDGGAGTTIYRFGGNFDDLKFLQYDITNLAYFIRNSGRSAVIGVGGGRDLLSAYAFGFRDVTGVELNPIFIDVLQHRLNDFNVLASLPGVHFEVDDARSWFASTGRGRGFDLVQMSMIDTWAATGMGALSLSENGLYTVEGWRDFISSLAPNGVLTVSRWFSPDNVGETGRLLGLAKAALLAMGIEDPTQHLFLAGNGPLATLIVDRAPFTLEEIGQLRAATSRLHYSILASPDASASYDLLREILDAPDAATLLALSAQYHLDVTPPTDERPFFFNQLRISDAFSMLSALDTVENASGVVSGNLAATLTLMFIVVLSAVLVLLIIVLPALPTVRHVSGRLIRAGTAYFLLIGLGFMFVEIGLIQRLSIFLGHPVYGLAVGLFGLILSTGLGSLLSDVVPLTNARRLVAWCGLIALYLGSLPFWLSRVVLAFEAQTIGGRAIVAIAMIAPAGLLMGFGFPTGMRLVNRIDQRPTPWFWAINGAAGVLAASIAVMVSIAFSISASIWTGAACYLLLAVAGVALMNIPAKDLPAETALLAAALRKS
jgi:hypothetical protein